MAGGKLLPNDKQEYSITLSKALPANEHLKGSIHWATRGGRPAGPKDFAEIGGEEKKQPETGGDAAPRSNNLTTALHRGGGPCAHRRVSRRAGGFIYPGDPEFPQGGGEMNRTGAAAIVISLSWVAAIVGQAQTTVPRAPMAEEVFKNVQVLKGIPVDQFMGTMGIFASALGKNCSECHGIESGGNWELYAKDTPLKQTARRMVLMVKQINDANFGGRQMVTCYSCHRVQARPKVTPSLVALYSAPPDEPDDIVDAAPGAAKADEIFDKYLTAIGGAARVAALTSYTAKGTYQAFDDAEPHALEVSARAPNQRLWVWHSGFGDHSIVYNGRDGWVTASRKSGRFRWSF
jgi:mono/diheme cytochrome c family protein